MNARFASLGLIAVMLGGCSTMNKMVPDPVKVHYAPGDKMPELTKVRRTGDFGIFYDNEKTPQMPVRVQGGEKVGFIRGGDGAIKAAAGEFRMNISNDAPGAYWKRLNYASD
jgi:hypothetical protein